MRMSIKLVFIIVSLIFSHVNVVFADWIATRVQAPGYYTTDSINWVMIRSGTTIPNASWVYTGKRGRLQLQRGDEFILYGPNTLAGLLQKGKQQRDTVLHQQFGKLLLNLETRKYQHAQVKTPFLAALVKGTEFEVRVDHKSARLDVKRGIVEVTDIENGQQTDVYIGQSADVARNRSFMRIAGKGQKAPIRRVAKARPEVPVVGERVRSKNKNNTQSRHDKRQDNKFGKTMEYNRKSERFERDSTRSGHSRSNTSSSSKNSGKSNSRSESSNSRTSSNSKSSNGSGSSKSSASRTSSSNSKSRGNSGRK